MGIDGESKTSFNTNYTVFMKNKYTYFHMRKKKCFTIQTNIY